MAVNCGLLDLPDLVLYKICSFIDCPFGLLRFGNTCSRLRNISVANSLWWSLALRWLRGLWIHMEEGSIEENSRDWFLDLITKYSEKSTCTNNKCEFFQGEIWERVDSRKFRFLVNLLRLAYTREKSEHPAVLYEQFLYDIAVFQRIDPFLDFSKPNFEFDDSTIQLMNSLSQASDRDLRRRKQPYKSLTYYVKIIASSRKKRWKDELFPAGPNGSISPLLICPLQGGIMGEISGLQGIAMCLSVVLEHRIRRLPHHSTLQLKTIWEIIKIYCSVFASEVSQMQSKVEARLETSSIRTVLLAVIEEGSYVTTQLQNILDYFSLGLKCSTICHDLYLLLKKYESLDYAVDDIRLQYRRSINEEIHKVLFEPNASHKDITRINLTDSDLIGGDNSRQEMCCAAFVSRSGILVTWHLTGRMRY